LNDKAKDTSSSSDPSLIFAKANADSIDSEFFGEVLNPEGVVQIANYIFRINAVTGYCYVMDSLYLNQYADLIAENIANPHIQKYSNEDDVLEIFESNLANRCSESGAPRIKKSQDFSPTYNPPGYPGYYGKLECKVVYQKAAIYFSLVAKAKSTIWAMTYLNGEMTYGYKRKCKNPVGLYSTTSFQGINSKKLSC